MTVSLPSFPAADGSPLDTCVRMRQTAPVVEVDPKHWSAMYDGTIPGGLAVPQHRVVAAGDGVDLHRGDRRSQDGSTPPIGVAIAAGLLIRAGDRSSLSGPLRGIGC